MELNNCYIGLDSNPTNQFSMEQLLKRINTQATVPDKGDLFSGTWQNQLGSEMRLHAHGAHVKGTYHTAVGQPTEKQSELVGFVLGDLITFTVNFGKSLASWSGQIETIKGKPEELVTLWHLVVNVKDEDEEKGIWQDTYAGADRFKRV